jgi:signal transduction histidine kinase
VLVRTPGAPNGVALSTTARPLRDRAGQISAAVVTIRDISARQAAEVERERLLAELHRSNAELSQFAYVASHDLRAPLRAIDSLACWLQEDLAPHFTPDTAEQMRLLRSRASRMDGLLRDLLEFSRLGRGDVEVEPVDVERLVGEVIDLVGPPRSFRFVREVTVTTFETAALPLKRVLMNLLANAVKHHDRPEGEVRVSVRDRGAFVELEVRDDGPGIPAAFQGKIFEMFQTLKPRDSLEGSGMGLAFVKKIVDGAGGTVAVESAGRGATFRVEWPRSWPAGQPRS